MMPRIMSFQNNELYDTNYADASETINCGDAIIPGIPMLEHTFAATQSEEVHQSRSGTNETQKDQRFYASTDEATKN